MRFLCIAFFLMSSLAGAQLSVPESAVRGDPVLCLVRSPEAVEALTLELLDPRMKCIVSSSGFEVRREAAGVLYCGIIGLSCGLKPGGYVLLASGRADGFYFRYSRPLRVQDRGFAEETISLDGSLTDLVRIDNPEKTRQSRELNAIINRVEVGSVFHLGRFTPPVESTRRTSEFGDIRLYVYSDGERQYRIHAGIDFGVPTGTPVAACAAGRVVLAKSRIVSGLSIVIEHLPGLYSLYYHLDRLSVVEGDRVSLGSGIGLSGSTGLATGPHLHWEIRAAGVAVNPDAFLGDGAIDIGRLADVHYSAKTQQERGGDSL